MVSIRECTFETNSSSCHCFVFCRDDLRQKIENQEVLYVGDFEYGDDNITYENDLNPNTIMDRNQVIEILDKFKNDVEDEEYMKSYQEWLRVHDFKNMSLKEIIEASDRDDISLDDILEKYEIYYTPVTLIFGIPGPYGESDTHILSQHISEQQGIPTWIIYTQVHC